MAKDLNISLEPEVCTLFSKVKRVFNKSGNGKNVPTYSFVYDDDGRKVLRHTGDTNLYERIQSHRDECLIENIVKKSVINPDILNQVEGQYYDATEMPNTLLDAQRIVLQKTNEFNSLPADIRKKFDFSVDKYIVEFGTQEFLDKLGYKKIEPYVGQDNKAENADVKKEGEL